MSIRKRQTDKEVWYAHVSAFRVVSLLFVYLSISIIAISAIIVYSPILDLLPGYPGSRSRELLISNILRLDSIEQKMHNISLYVDNQSLIINGETPFSKGSTPIVDSSSKRVFEPLAPSVEDSVLRFQLDSMGIYKLPELDQKSRVLLGSINLMSPLNGLVINKFAPSDKMYGVEIATIGNKPIIAINDGSVIFSTWTHEMGNVMHIQHPGDLISIYKNSAHILYDIGDVVKSGDVIGYTGEGVSGEDNKGLITFEIWSNGVPVDPERYVWF